MGVGASNPGKHSGGSKRHHHGGERNYQKNGWTQHYQNYNRTAAATSNSNQNQWDQPEDHPKPSVTRARRSPGGVLIQQATVTQPQPTQPILVTTTTRIHTPAVQCGVQQPKPSGQQKRAGRGNNKPKIDYSTVECGVCGHTGHGTRFCHHRHQTCHICHGSGHIASVCRQKVHHEASRYKPRQVK
uniref:CCHC-type domain-containing protein n=1 Tax=Culex tarsalis TaxID=7177 RepID=A0A1Q3F1U4_CULTA